MVLSNPWLSEPSSRERLSRERLEERILNLLSSQNMCVIATSGWDGPLATPVRYFHLSFSIVFSASPTSPKVRNIVNDPRPSVGVFAPLVGLASSRGAQIFGNARVLGQGDAGYTDFMSVVRWHGEHVEEGRDVSNPPELTLVVIDADRIVYTEHWLRRDGYAPRQFWAREAGPD